MAFMIFMVNCFGSKICVHPCPILAFFASFVPFVVQSLTRF